MRLILVLAGVLSVAWASSRGPPPPPRNPIRRGGPFYHHHGTPRLHPHPHQRRPSRSHYSHHSSYNSPLISHGHGHGHHPNPSYGGAVNNNYAYVAGGGGGHGHGHQRQQVYGVPGGGQALTSLTQAFSPVQPPIVTVSPIIKYRPGADLPGSESFSHPHPHHGPEHSVHGGKSTISKSVYVFSAPSDPSDHIRPQIVKQFPQQNQKHYQVLFINAPNPPPHPQHTVELPQPPEMKTQIYVLHRQPETAPPVKIIPANVPVHKPEVYFIRYKNNKDDAEGYTPVPSDAPIIYPTPQPVDYGHHQSLGQQGEQVIYQDQPQQFHQQIQPEFNPEYNSLVPLHHEQHQQHHHQQEQHHHQPLEYIPQEQLGGGHNGYNGHGHHEEYSNNGLAQYAPHHSHVNGIQYTVGGGDPYSDHSRLSAHYSSVTGRPVVGGFNSRSSSPSSSSPSPLLPPLKKNSSKKRRLRGKPSTISRIDDIHENDAWTPINRHHHKRELEDGGMSGI